MSQIGAVGPLASGGRGKATVEKRFDAESAKKGTRADEFKMPVGERVNTLRVSQFVACHDRPVKCPICGQPFALGIHSVMVRWEAAPISAEQASSLELGTLW